MQRESHINESVTLPPKVRGKARGVFEIKIENISWKKTGSERSHFESLDLIANFLWWGQTNKAVRKVSLGRTKHIAPTAALQYRILTDCNLFHNYLQNCEPIKIILSTRTSNLEVGLVNLIIPSKIIEDCRNLKYSGALSSSDLQRYPIQNKRGDNLGDILLKYKIMFFETMVEHEKMYDETQIVYTARELEKLKDVRSCKYITEQDLNNDKNESKCSARLLHFLSGRKMSKEEERLALKELRNTSPLRDNYLHRLNFPNIRCELSEDSCQHKVPTYSRCSANHNTQYNEIESLHINVKYLKLLPAAIHEIHVKSLINTSFTIEAKNLISENCFDSFRFYSTTFNDLEQRIDFNKDDLKIVTTKSNETQNSKLSFTVWWREYGSRYSRCLGTANFWLKTLFDSHQINEDIKLRVKSCSAGSHVADLYCKLNVSFNKLQNNGIYSEEKKSCDHSLTCDCFYLCRSHLHKDPIDEIRMVPNNKSCDSRNSKESPKLSDTKTNKNITVSSPHNTNNINRKKIDESDEDDVHIKITEKNQSENQTLLKGLLYVGKMNGVENIENFQYFCVARSFWKDDPSSSEFSKENNFNFIETFSLVNDKKFLDRVRNNVLIIELWQKSIDSHEKLFGIVRLQLHQYFIAFRDSMLAEHLCKAKLPVISNDGFVPICSPLSAIICGSIEILLCIGSSEQINNIKQSKGLNSSFIYDNSSLYSFTPHFSIPKQDSEIISNTQNKLAQFDKCLQPENVFNNQGNNSQIIDYVKNKEELSNYSALTIDTQPNTSTYSPKFLPSNELEPPQQQQTNTPNSIKRTSDLLDILQKALTQPPNQIEAKNSKNFDSITTPIQVKNTFKILLEIECALHLPRNSVKIISKKTNKRKGKQSRFPPNEEPSAYVTFQAEEGSGQKFKSHEGMVYATNVVEKCSNPFWEKHFEVSVANEYLINENKPFVLRVWRKAATDLAHCRLLPTPMEDSIIGVSSVDLTVFMAKIPFISGWYNIIDFSGKIVGQIKLSIKLTENISTLVNFSNLRKQDLKFSKNNISFLNSPNTLHNISFDSNDLGLGIGMSSSLSKAFKRKLVELEEINQRLRARLLDVTGEADPGVDFAEIDDEQMDEFERDLNTECNEDENSSVDSGESKNLFLLNNEQEIQAKNNMNHRNSSTNSTNQDKIRLISEFMQNTDISSDTPVIDNEKE